MYGRSEIFIIRAELRTYCDTTEISILHMFQYIEELITNTLDFRYSIENYLRTTTYRLQC